MPTEVAGKTIEQLIASIDDAELRAQLDHEIKVLKDRKSFGLVYERRLPETVVVGDTDPLKVGDHVRPKQVVDVDEDFRVIALNSRTATLLSLESGEESKVPVRDLLTIKRFGDPAYLGLESLGEVRRSATRPAHVVINGENYHALQALTLIYERQADCI
jgi:adenine-specific DNA-methyltransferase